MRHNTTERLGVFEIAKIFTKELGWIFREQPIVDVGLDAIVEESTEGNPTGKFLAIQIKSGNKNFYDSGNTLTHYVSHIHYNYWLNLEIPIILVAHIPETDKVYWQEINKKNFKKTKKRWKIELSKNQELNTLSKNRLSQIINNQNQKNFVFELFKGKIENDNLFDLAENTECISDAKDSVLAIVDIINNLRERTDQFNVKLGDYIKANLSDKDPQVRASIKGFGKDLNVVSKRLENEIELFSELYSEGFYAFEKLSMVYTHLTSDTQNLEKALLTIQKIPKAVDEALEGINVMRNGVSSLPKKYAVLKEAKMQMLEIIDLLISEFTESKEMVIGISIKLNEQ